MPEKSKVSDASAFATSLAKDEKFRKELLSAISHAKIARHRTTRKLGYLAVARGMSGDPKLRRELKKMMNSIDRVVSRSEKKGSHKVRTTLLVIGGVAGAAIVAVKLRAHEKLPIGGTSSRTLEASKEVNVPVSVAYNQWTQFEDFPLFMEGVEHVQQLDDKRLRWVADIAGKKAEWDATILEQQPDRQISWISEDGKKTRGTVTFEPRAEDKTLVRLSMSYQAEGPAEQLGSAAGLDLRRVAGDLDRFKELVETRGAETDTWRGEIEAGQTQ